MAMCDVKKIYDSLQVLEGEEASLSRRERLLALTGPLLAWYGSRARSLPWREEPAPYRVWISEIMLQQTRVEAVKPYFERFMAAFPGVKELAEAEDDHLMKMWEGLGYYNRARNLKAAAGKVMEEYGGQLPVSYEELLSLPGIGSYTAGAIASIAYGIPVPAVDGNVLRVISRILGDREDIKRASVKKRMEEELGQVMPRTEVSSYNQGLIELGALVCIPGGEPRCSECPAEGICLTARNGWWREIPCKAPKKPRRLEDWTILVIGRPGRALLRRRPDTGLLASLYEFPGTEGHISEKEALAAAAALAGVEEEAVDQVISLPASKHIFSHVEWHMTGYRILLKEEGEGDGLCFMADCEALSSSYALPNAFRTYTEAFMEECKGQDKLTKKGYTEKGGNAHETDAVCIQSPFREGADPGTPSGDTGSLYKGRL